MKLRIGNNTAVFLVLLLPAILFGQAPATPPQPPVRAIAPARNPLPAEEASADVNRFSFIVYGDTRGRRDGVELQYEHSLVVDGMLRAIKRQESTPHPVRFILQTGDAVVNGGDARQWNSSFVGLIDRLTTEGGVPYFLAPGNHDVTTAQDLQSPQRQQALGNYLLAMSQLIPPDNAQRRLAGYPTYAIGYGNTFILALDSNIPNDPTQFEWAKAQLESLNRTRYRHVIAMFHHPVFSSGPHGGARIEPPTAVLRERYMPLFRTHHVNVVLAGHDHLFEHWVERYSDSSGRHRMDLVVTGGGGAPLYGYQGEPDLTAYVRTSPDAKLQLEHLVKPDVEPGANPYHFLVVQVDGESLDIEVIGVDWGAGYRPYRSNRTGLSDR
jgi:hypothetical protein